MFIVVLGVEGKNIFAQIPREGGAPFPIKTVLIL
jgi:hypothetical protein